MFGQLSACAWAQMIERSRCDQEASMLDGFVMADEAGLVDIVLAAHANGLALPMRDAGAVTAVLPGGHNTKTAIVGMLLERLAGLTAGDTGCPPQRAQAIQRPPARGSLRCLRGGIDRFEMPIGMDIHPHLVHGAALFWEIRPGARTAKKLLPTGDRKVASGMTPMGNKPKLSGIAVGRCMQVAFCLAKRRGQAVEGA